MEISLQCFANLVEEGVCDHRGLDLLNATQSGNTTGLISSNPSRPLWRSFPGCLRAEQKRLRESPTLGEKVELLRAVPVAVQLNTVNGAANAGEI